MSILRLAKLNAAAGRLAVEDGRIDDALTAVRRGSAIASSLANEPILIVQFIRLAVDRLDAGIAKRILQSPALRADHVEALQAMNPPRDPRRDLQMAMVVETKAMSTVFRSRAGAPQMFSRESQPGNALALGIVGAVTRPYLLREKRLWIEIMSAKIDSMNEPRYRRDESEDLPVLRKWDVLVRVMLRNLESIRERCDLAESRYRLLETAIAIERQRIGSGKTPATIAALDPLTGRAFAYESDGTRWRIRSEADVSAMDAAKVADPLLDWSRGE